MFKSPEQRVWLEQLLHPLIRQELIRQLQPADYALPNTLPYTLPYTLLVTPLLLETDQHELVDRVVVVDVAEDTQIARTVARDSNTRDQVERIMATQIPRQQRRAQADEIIDNDRPLADVAQQVAQLHHQFVATLK